MSGLQEIDRVKSDNKMRERHAQRSHAQAGRQTEAGRQTAAQTAASGKIKTLGGQRKCGVSAKISDADQI